MTVRSTLRNVIISAVSCYAILNLSDYENGQVFGNIFAISHSHDFYTYAFRVCVFIIKNTCGF